MADCKAWKNSMDGNISSAMGAPEYPLASE
jgi:hypothetical protein